jgi:hypothetical protein
MITKIKIVLLICSILFFSNVIHAKQLFLIQTNMLGDIFMLPNVGVEYGITDRVTLSADVWHLSYDDSYYFDASITNIRGLVRFYFKERFNGLFIGTGYSNLLDSNTNGLDFKIGYLYKENNYYSIGFSLGITRYVDNEKIESEGVVPNIGINLGFGF